MPCSFELRLGGTGLVRQAFAGNFNASGCPGRPASVRLGRRLCRRRPDRRAILHRLGFGRYAGHLGSGSDLAFDPPMSAPEAKHHM
jgi:hypothetical protein